jgi:hypothetical protein
VNPTILHRRRITGLIVRLTVYQDRMGKVERDAVLHCEDPDLLQNLLRFQRQLCVSPLLNHLDPL